jgi:quinol monooxygenase YgiN
MANFNVQNVSYQGNVVAERQLGQVLQTTGITPKEFRKQGNNELIIKVQVDFSHLKNQVPVYKFSVTTTFLLMDFNFNDLNKEMGLISYLIIRSHSNLEAILYSKFQDINAHFFIPSDPDFTSAVSQARELLLALNTSFN